MEKKILIIDDSLYDRKSIKMYLEAGNGNYKIFEAVSKLEGVEMIKSEKPDCIILDYELPDGNGLEIIDEINIDVPVVLLTGQGDNDIKEIAKQKGISRFLTKENHSMQSLHAVIKYVMNNYINVNFA